MLGNDNNLEQRLLDGAERREGEEQSVGVNSSAIVVSAKAEYAQEAEVDPFDSLVVFKTILGSTASFGFRSAIVGAHYAGNGLIMSSLGSNAAAASSVVTTIQNLTIGAASGFLIGTGVELGKALGRKDEKAAHAITKTGIAMSLALGSVATAAFLSTRYTLPLILDPNVAEAAADYFETFAIAAIPDLLVWTNGQIIFKVEKNALMPLIATIAYRIPALGLSYYLGKQLNLGPRGVGLGSGISGWTCVILFQPWFSKEVYKKYNLYSPGINDFWKHFKEFMNSGWQLSLQRITEWGNLAGITQIVGAWSSQGLLAEQPSLLSLVLCNSLSQGCAQTSMMIASEDCSAMKKALKDFENTGDEASLKQVEKYIAKNTKHFYISNGTGLFFNFLLAGALYLSKQRIIDLYIPEGTPASTLSLANTLFWINDLSLIPDALRIILGGQLRGWGDLLIPTLASLALMSGIGILAGALIGVKEGENILPLFIARVITLLCAAVFNYYRFQGHIQKDERAYESAVLLGKFFSSFDAYENFGKEGINLSSSARLVQNAASFGMEVRNVPGDGNCFFHAVALALNDGKKYEDVRRIVAQHVRDNIELYDEFITEGQDAFLRNISQGGTWADHVVILALSRVLNINIVLVRSDDADPIIIRQNNATNTIYLGYEVNHHYQLLSGISNESLRALFEAAEVDDLGNTALRDEEDDSQALVKPVAHLFYGNQGTSINAGVGAAR